MLCQKCKKNEANVKYTEIINGEKKEMMLCEECSHKLGLDNINFNMPIDFSSFFGGLLEDEYNSPEFMPLFQTVKELKCDNCNMTYDEFVSQGKFGCPECYEVFSSKIDSLLKRLHGSSEYRGRKALNNALNKENTSVRGTAHSDPKNGKSTSKDSKLDKLQKDLKKAIADERYEDAAKIRDEIKSINKKHDKE